MTPSGPQGAWGYVVPESHGNTPSTITVRFGEPILEAGFTVVPNLILRSYTQLGISPIEMMFVIHVWEYWWSERDPYPSLGTIADRMGMTRRNARRHVQSLRDKGFLIVNERNGDDGQLTSEYDFEPLIRAVLDLSTPLGQKRPRPSEGNVRPPRTDSTYEEDEDKKDKPEEESFEFEAYFDDFRREFRDSAPRSSTMTRARRLYEESGLDPSTFRDHLYEARRRTKAASGIKSKTAYFFATLEDLVSTGG